MPRNVRNFWIELEVDGRKERIATGPVSADGGFTMTIYQRSQGEIVTALHVQGRADRRGDLSLRVSSPRQCIMHPNDNDNGRDIHVETWRD